MTKKITFTVLLVAAILFSSCGKKTQTPDLKMICYTAEDLMHLAEKQGRVVMAAILDQFPEAVIFNLPGVLRCRPIERRFQIGLIEMMAERNAPGGFHVGTEYTYGMRDPVTDLATSRFEDPSVPFLVNEKTVKYWQEKCTIAPGVWPLHLVETGSPHYPVQPWKKEADKWRGCVPWPNVTSGRTAGIRFGISIRRRLRPNMD